MVQYFERLCGARVDKSRCATEDVIAYLLDNCNYDLPMVMVGDTVFDIIGAAAHSIPAIGVCWGYGNVEEMKDAGAVAIAQSVLELLNLLENE